MAGETWLQVVKGLPRFRGGEEAFRAWLFTIARHRAVDAGRSRSRRSDVPLAATETLEQPTTPDAAELALEAISTRSVVALIKSLPRDHAEIIMLRVVAGLEAAEAPATPPASTSDALPSMATAAFPSNLSPSCM